MKRFFSFFLALAVFCTCFSGCGYKSDMSFSCILTENVLSLDPQTVSNNSERLVINSIFEGLCRVNSDGEATPGVAESWESNEDFTVFTFHLRKNAKWHNGNDLTASDFVFGIRRSIAAQTKSSSVDDLLIIKRASNIHAGEMDSSSLGVTATDEYTVVFELEQSYEFFPVMTANAHYMPCNEEYFNSVSGHYGMGSGYLLTNGPFTFTTVYSWDPGISIGLARAVYYHGEHRAEPASLTFIMQYDSEIDEDPIAALADGTTDVLQLSRTAAAEAERSEYALTGLDNSVIGLLLNPEAEALSSSVIRGIFLKSIDREQLLQRLPEGMESTASLMPMSAVQSGYTGLEMAVQDDSALYDLAPALSSLSLSETPSITIICRSDDLSLNLVNSIIQSWNAKLGNSFNLEQLSDSDFTSRIETGDYEAALYSTSSQGNTPYDALGVFYGLSYPQLMSSESFDSLYSSSRFSPENYPALEAIVSENNLFYPIAYDKTYYAASPLTKGIEVLSPCVINFFDAKKND